MPPVVLGWSEFESGFPYDLSPAMQSRIGVLPLVQWQLRPFGSLRLTRAARAFHERPLRLRHHHSTPRNSTNGTIHHTERMGCQRSPCVTGCSTLAIRPGSSSSSDSWTALPPRELAIAVTSVLSSGAGEDSDCATVIATLARPASLEAFTR